VLDQDSTLRFAREGLERAQARATLGAELQGYIEKPRRLAATEVREAAKAALERVRATGGPANALAAQAGQVQSILNENDLTVEVSLNSDGLTDVTIFRVGRLGAFSERRVGLKPGVYTIVGSREGYRDVRREITVNPGQSVLNIEIHCEDKI
jgi:hypothetical protein